MSWRKWLAALALAAAAIYFFRSLLSETLRAGAGVVTTLVYLAAYLFAIVVVPLAFLWLGMFVYSLFLRPYLRVWHINRIRQARHLLDAVERGKNRE
jgi:hypothetical protein